MRPPRKPSQAKRQSSVGRALEPLRGVELRQLLVALVDLLELERLLVAGEVEVVLLVELGDEAVGLVAERVELAGRSGRSPSAV